MANLLEIVAPFAVDYLQTPLKKAVKSVLHTKQQLISSSIIYTFVNIKIQGLVGRLVVSGLSRPNNNLSGTYLSLFF